VKQLLEQEKMLGWNLLDRCMIVACYCYDLNLVTGCPTPAPVNMLNTSSEKRRDSTASYFD